MIGGLHLRRQATVLRVGLLRDLLQDVRRNRWAALQTDVLARVYHDRFPDRSAGAAPKRARRE